MLIIKYVSCITCDASAFLGQTELKARVANSRQQGIVLTDSAFG